MIRTAPEKVGPLSYQTVKRERPIPLWKHIVFGPLLVWVGLFIIGALIAAGVGFFVIVQQWLGH